MKHMKKHDLTKRFAQHARLTQAQAADELDRVIHELLGRLRRGQPASLPGFGTLLPNNESELPFERVRELGNTTKKVPS